MQVILSASTAKAGNVASVSTDDDRLVAGTEIYWLSATALGEPT